MTWINRDNAPSNLPMVRDLRGSWVNGKFDTRIAGGCNIFGYDNTVWDKVKKESKFMFSTAEYSDSIYKKLSDKLMFRSLEDVYFSGTSGSDAVEAAIRAAYLINKKPKIAARQGAWHGSTLLASNISKNYFYSDYNDMYTFDIVRKPGLQIENYQNISDLVDSDIEFLKQQTDIGVFIIEPLPGTSFGLSYLFDRPDAYNKLRKYCDDNGIVLIFDEVTSGFKTGKKYFTEHLEIDPDYLVLSKALTSGVIPFSAVIGKKGYFTNFTHGHTYSGHYLGAVAANHTIDYFYENLDNCLELEKEFKKYFNFSLGSFYSTYQSNVKYSDKVYLAYGKHKKAVFVIPLNTPKKHFEFVLKEVLI